MPRSDAQRLIAKSKQSERDLGKWMLEHDGPDPAMRGIASSTGRVGHITQMQFDVISRTYASENKNVRLSKTFLQWWLQILDVAADRGKVPLLSIEPSNVVPSSLNGGRARKIPRMHIITEDRHAELLRAEQRVAELEALASETTSNTILVGR
jgi:hypothetical protein